MCDKKDSAAKLLWLLLFVRFSSTLHVTNEDDSVTQIDMSCSTASPPFLSSRLFDVCLPGSTEVRAFLGRIMSALKSLLFAQTRILRPLATNISTLSQFPLFRMQMDRTSDSSWVSALSQGFYIIIRENSTFEEPEHRSYGMSLETAWGFSRSCDHYWR